MFILLFLFAGGCSLLYDDDHDCESGTGINGRETPEVVEGGFTTDLISFSDFLSDFASFPLDGADSSMA